MTWHGRSSRGQRADWEIIAPLSRGWVVQRTIKLLESPVDGSGAATTGHSDVKLVGMGSHGDGLSRWVLEKNGGVSVAQVRALEKTACVVFGPLGTASRDELR
jgi:hypothetical protein